MAVRALTLGFLSLALASGVAYAQIPGVSQEVTATGRLDHVNPIVGGPTDVYVGTIGMEPGTTYGGWHTHPGPVVVVITAGELALYGPDQCRTAYPAGSAYVALPDTLYDLRNEGPEALQLTFTGLIPAGQAATVFGAAPAATCEM
jgi:quercetin dioxygenase-like cupin family protein